MRTTKDSITIVRDGQFAFAFPIEPLLQAIDMANVIMTRYAQNGLISGTNPIAENDVQPISVDLFNILGPRNLSAFVGEVYVASLAGMSNGVLQKNPHQDGYPDLLLLDEYGRQCWSNIANYHDKAPFSPFSGGGIEVKATCGAVPTPEICRRKYNREKPEIGDSRLELVTGYDWKAHHRETNNLVGIFWDFCNGIPCIVALFYSSSLTINDWGKIVQPREGGGRTTSVSIMTREGVRKMAKGCLYCKDDSRLIHFLSEYNNINLANEMH